MAKLLQRKEWGGEERGGHILGRLRQFRTSATADVAVFSGVPMRVSGLPMRVSGVPMLRGTGAGTHTGAAALAVPCTR